MRYTYLVFNAQQNLPGLVLDPHETPNLVLTRAVRVGGSSVRQAWFSPISLLVWLVVWWTVTGRWELWSLLLKPGNPDSASLAPGFSPTSSRVVLLRPPIFFFFFFSSSFSIHHAWAGHV